MPRMTIPGHCRGVLLLALLLSGCGRSDQSAAQTSPLPLAPSALPTTATAAVESTRTRTQPTPDNPQAAASVTAAVIRTGVAANRQTAAAMVTATAAWAQTPEPTIIPPSGGVRLRDQWPAASQQVAPTTRLFLRNPGRDGREPDTFWEVQLPDGQLRRLPTIEQSGVDDSTQLSPNGRFLAYLTGHPKTMERTLRLLDLSQGSDRFLAPFVTAGSPRCALPFAWSPDGRSLAVITLRDGETGPLSLLQLYDDVATNQPPHTLIELPSPLQLVGWLDAEHLLVVHWKFPAPPIQFLAVDRKGQSTLVSEPGSKELSCAVLSPDRQSLIYNQQHRVKHLRLGTGQEEPFPWSPEDVVWVGEGNTLLISPFGQERRVRLVSLDQPQQASAQEPGIFLSPPYQADYWFGIIGASPDGQTLVACEQPSTDNPRIRTRQSRTWLYSIPNDRWTLLDIRQDFSCAVVAGWSSAGGGQ